MATTQYAFGSGLHKNTGVFVDGAYGEDHAVEVVAGLLKRVLRVTDDKEAEKLLDEYENEELEEEFYGEWLDDATDVLNENTAPGLVWEWEAGDLILLDEEDDE